MTKQATLALAAAILLAGTPAAFADDVRCPGGATGEWKSIDEARAAVDALGYKDIREIERDDGCYEIEASDAEGRRVELYLDPQSLAVVKMERD